jgi:hypothetical protein
MRDSRPCSIGIGSLSRHRAEVDHRRGKTTTIPGCVKLLPEHTSALASNGGLLHWGDDTVGQSLNDCKDDGVPEGVWG